MCREETPKRKILEHKNMLLWDELRDQRIARGTRNGIFRIFCVLNNLIDFFVLDHRIKNSDTKKIIILRLQCIS
jgi:hypothetical protein